MRALTLRQIAHIVRGSTLLPYEQLVTALGTDSRSVAPGALFFALRGERFDGHDFVDAVVARGAIPVVARTHPVADPTAMLLVDDPQGALIALASALRTLHPGRVIAITGSVGKTTVKDMCAAALSAFGTVARTIGNFNNRIGLPLTLGATSGHEDFLVLELGMSAPGEICELVHIARPDVALVTCAAAAHLEFFESVDGIADAKAELYEHASPNTTLIANADDPRMLPRARHFATGHRGQPLTFGRHGAEVRVLASRHLDGRLHVELDVAGTPIALNLAVLGHHQADNAAAALAIVHALGLDVRAAAAALSARFTTPKRRLELVRHGPLTVLDDCYNASPSSMRAALMTFAELATGQPRVAVLGSMLELGPEADRLHREVAALTAGLDAVFCTGPHAHALATGAREAGVPTLHEAPDLMDLSAPLAALSGKPGWVLLKGSRGTRLERAHDLLADSSTIEPLDSRDIASAGGHA